MSTTERRYSAEFDRMLAAAFGLAAGTLAALHGTAPVAPPAPGGESVSRPERDGADQGECRQGGKAA